MERDHRDHRRFARADKKGRPLLAALSFPARSENQVQVMRPFAEEAQVLVVSE
jgi:hypothetical protein